MTDYRVGIYIRLSLADGDGKAESDSIGNQRELIHQFLDRHPQLKNAPRTEFVDDGYTGTNTDRPQFQALMKELRAGKRRAHHGRARQSGRRVRCSFAGCA